jgi:cytochrome P450
MGHVNTAAQTSPDRDRPVPLNLDPDPAGPDAGPYAVWDRLRKQAAVHRIATPDGPPAWLVTRYRDVRAGLTDPRLSVHKANARGGDYQGFTLPPALDAHLLNRDGTDHARLRRLIGPALSPRRADDLRASVQAAADELLDAVAPTGRADLVADLAVPLPLLVACDLLGVPDEQRSLFRTWAANLLAPEPDQAPRARDTLGQMLGIVRGLIAARRAAPGDDLISALVAARDDQDRLSEDELTSMLFYVLFVWYEISVDLFANAALTLLRRPDHLGALRERPDVLPAAVEELLRHETPQALAAPRFPLVDVEIGGTTIPAGDTVLLGLACANRDPDRFPGPDLLDLARDADGHLSFGLGAHTCLGAPLVRLEAEVVFGTLARRFPNLALAGDAERLRWRPGFRHRGLRELPVTL